MIWHVHIHPLAQSDVANAREWYDQQRVGLGAEFLLVVADALAQLEQYPSLHPIYYRGLRCILTKRFPYKLFYLMEGKTVHVLRILHGRQEHRRVFRP